MIQGEDQNKKKSKESAKGWKEQKDSEKEQKEQMNCSFVGYTVPTVDNPSELLISPTIPNRFIMLQQQKTFWIPSLQKTINPYNFQSKFFFF